MHPHARGSSFPAASRPNHRFLPSSLDGCCCDGSRSACGYARPCLAPFALHERRQVFVFASTFFVFPWVSFFSFLFVYVFQIFFLELLLRRQAAKGPSLINNFSSAMYWIRARIALLPPPSPSQGEGIHIFHIQFKYLLPY